MSPNLPPTERTSLLEELNGVFGRKGEENTSVWGSGVTD
jgi:hypothetical protein